MPDICGEIRFFHLGRKALKFGGEKASQNRKTVVREVPKAFSEAFYNAPKTMERWDSFLKGIGHDSIPLEKVILEIKDFFLPILSTINI